MVLDLDGVIAAVGGADEQVRLTDPTAEGVLGQPRSDDDGRATGYHLERRHRRAGR
jgi:hypothetical protein